MAVNLENVNHSGITFTVVGLELRASISGGSVPAGGTTGQALVKVDGSDHNTAWAAVATGAQGALADSAVQPAGIASFASAVGFTDMVALTQAAYNAIGTPDVNTLYFII